MCVILKTIDFSYSNKTMIPSCVEALDFLVVKCTTYL